MTELGYNPFAKRTRNEKQLIMLSLSLDFQEKRIPLKNLVCPQKIEHPFGSRI